MNICRQCFREKSQDIGFNKVRLLCRFVPKDRGYKHTNGYLTKISSTLYSTVKITKLLSNVAGVFFFAFSRSIRLKTTCISDFTLLGDWWAKKPWEEKRNSDFKPESFLNGCGGWKKAEGEINTWNLNQIFVSSIHLSSIFLRSATENTSNEHQYDLTRMDSAVWTWMHRYEWLISRQKENGRCSWFDTSYAVQPSIPIPHPLPLTGWTQCSSRIQSSSTSSDSFQYLSTEYSIRPWIGWTL